MTLRTNSTHVLHVARPAALIGVLVLLWGISFAPSVLALPPGGAATVDTPGTSSSVSPGSVEQCGSINFEVNGFPAGETVNVKIDDGSVSGGDASVQGQGVVVRQPIDSSGTASGTVDIDCNFPTGTHWLRFLATGGPRNEGYTNRSPDFEVTAQAGGGGDSNDSGNSGDSGTTSGTTGGTTGGTTNNGGGNSASGGGTASRGNTASGSRGNSASSDDDDDDDDEDESTSSGGGGGGASGGAARAGGGGSASSGGGSGGASSGSTSNGSSRGASGGGSGSGGSSGGSGGSGSGGKNSSSSKNGSSGGSTKASGAKAAGSAKNATGNKAKASGFSNKKSKKKSTNSDGPSNGGLFDKAAQDEEITPTANSVPYIGFFVGGAILLVGMTAINAWLYLQRNAAATAAATAAAAVNAANQRNQQEQSRQDDNSFDVFGTGNYRS